MPANLPNPASVARVNRTGWNWYLSQRNRRRRRNRGGEGIAALSDIPGLRFEFVADLDYLPILGGLIAEWSSTDFAITLSPEVGNCTYVPLGLNDHPAVYIQGGRLTGGMAAMTGTTATFGFVGQLTDLENLPGYPRFIAMWDGVQGMDWDNPESWTIADYTSGTSLRVVRDSQADLDVFSFDPALPVVAVVRRDGTSTSILVKQPGLAVSLVGTTAAGAFNSDTLGIGGNPENNNMWGYVTNVGCWTRCLSDAEAQAVLEYFAGIYGI